jgi:bla regulator protein BlaR1
MTGSLVVDSLGWTLLHFIWQGALIGCVTALLLTLLRNARPETRYNIACSGLLACLLWPAAELSLRLQGGDMVTAQMRFADALVASGAAGAPGGLLGWLQAQLLWIVGLWAVCAAAMSLRMALGLLWIRQAQLSRRGDARLQAVVSQLSRQFGVARGVSLRVVDQLDSPVTAGWLRPVILVPAALATGMPHELLNALLAHEMAHVRRMDYLVTLGQNVIEILLFYHPAVWWISGRIRAEREQIADDLAARHTGEPRTLALALSELDRFQAYGQQLAIAANGGDLLSRVKRLVRPDTQALNWKAAIPVLGLAAACLTVYAHASVQSQPALSAPVAAPGAALAPAAAPAAPPVPAGREALADAGPAPATTAAVADFRSCKKPVWPGSALREGRTGTVTLGFKINQGGKAEESRVIKSSGHEDLDQAARAGIALCSFQAGTEGGKPVASWMRMQYVWTLK